MTNIKDIAKLAGISKSTVSRLINKNGYVKPETKKRILAVMEEMNFRPNMFAKGMRTNRSFSIGILFPDLSNPFFAEWYKVIDSISKEKGYLNYICITDPEGLTEENRVEDLLARHIDGFIFFSYMKKEKLLQQFVKISKHTPVICCDAQSANGELSYIFADGEKGTFEATEYLVRCGKKQIAYVKGPAKFAVTANRLSGYKNALIANGRPVDKNLIFEGDFSLGSGYQAAAYFMELSEPPDAIITATDYMALGVLNYLKNAGYAVPGDVAVCGFDDLHFAKNAEPSLTTIKLPIEEMARETILSLIDLIEGNKPYPFQKKYNCELVIRNSTNN
ncbi:MAG: LacI family DNA-binding transcriptional regulator [Prolixibacteraceae bacterium]|jgi:LacI family transcriptional regulator|nr:LacI family DNA-binding transcriptional regulator [Prolixibacteraceae bacterium]